MSSEFFELPESDEADYLLAGLARLVELRGVGPLVAAPLLLPEPRFFPDAVKARKRKVAVLIRRLLAYAELSPKRVDIEIVDSPTAILDRAGHEFDVANAAAWFIDVDHGVYHFGIKEAELVDDEGLIGTLGHEVAHAYRTHHGIVVRDTAQEEKLTDLTTIYLGFGVFTLQSSFQFKSGHLDARGQQLLYERRQRGYLIPGQLAFLLAAQLVVRGNRDLLREVTRSLSPNQADAVRRAWDLLCENRQGLIEQLRLPPVREWPPLKTLDQALVPLPRAKVRAHDPSLGERKRELREQIAFRVAGTHAKSGAMAGAILGFFPPLLLSWGAEIWLATFGLAIAGYLIGKRLSAPSCSSCQHHVRRRATRCSFCSIRLVADINDPMDRFDAEQRFRGTSADG